MRQLTIPGCESVAAKTSKVSNPAFALLRYLYNLGNINGWVAPKVATMSRVFKAGRSTVLRWIAQLKSAGYIAVRRRGPTSASFSVLQKPPEKRKKLIRDSNLAVKHLKHLVVAFNSTCHYCGRIGSATMGADGRTWEVDHSISLKNGGSDEPENLRLSCASCNRKKHRRNEVEFLKSGTSCETCSAKYLITESPSESEKSKKGLAYSDDFGLACAFGVPFDQWTEPDRRAIVSAAVDSGLPARVAGHIFGGLIRLPRFRGKGLGYAVVAFRGELAAYRAAESGRKPNVSDNPALHQPYFGFERATFEALLAEMPEHQRRALESAA